MNKKNCLCVDLEKQFSIKIKDLIALNKAIDEYFESLEYLPIVFVRISDYVEHFDEITDQSFADGVRLIPIDDNDIRFMEDNDDDCRTSF